MGYLGIKKSITISFKNDSQDMENLKSIVKDYGFELFESGITIDGQYEKYTEPDNYNDFSWIQLQAEIESKVPLAEQEYSEGEIEDEYRGDIINTESLWVEI